MGDCVPVAGSTCMANDNPDVAAIFSPATDTVAKAIAKTKPAVSPSAISTRIVSIKTDAATFVKSGAAIHPCKNIASENMIIILIIIAIYTK